MSKDVRFSRTTGTPIALRVVEATAETLGTDARALEPLYDTVDADALETIVDTASGNTSVVVRFEYAECFVEVTGAGVVSVDRLE